MRRGQSALYLPSRIARARLRPRAIGLLACLGVVGCDPAPAPPREVGGRALAPLRLGACALLPAAAVGSAPRAPSPSAAFAHDDDALLPTGRSYSLGTTSRGRLLGARELSASDGPLAPRPISVARGATWGTQELVSSLERAARRVAERWPGSRTFAGDLSAQHGGDIPGHVSHNSGRDADVAFFARDVAGRIADGPDFVRMTAAGTSATGALVFDAARNWELIEGLLRDPRVQIQWVFVANHLEARLLEHARAAAVDPELVARAEAVLKQPGDSSPHAEHFHIRFYCALDERVEGCLDAGRVHPWVDTFEDALAERVRQVVPLLRSGGDDEVRYAVTRLVRLRARAAIEHLEPLTTSTDPAIAALARDAIAFLRGERTPPEWAHLTPEDAGE